MWIVGALIQFILITKLIFDQATLFCLRDNLKNLITPETRQQSDCHCQILTFFHRLLLKQGNNSLWGKKNRLKHLLTESICKLQRLKHSHTDTHTPQQADTILSSREESCINDSDCFSRTLIHEHDPVSGEHRRTNRMQYWSPRFIFFQNSFPFNQLQELKRWLLPCFSRPDYWLLFCCFGAETSQNTQPFFFCTTKQKNTTVWLCLHHQDLISW